MSFSHVASLPPSVGRSVRLVNARKGAERRKEGGGESEGGREGRKRGSVRSSCVNMTTFPLMRALCSSERGEWQQGLPPSFGLAGLGRDLARALCFDTTGICYIVGCVEVADSMSA